MLSVAALATKPQSLTQFSTSCNPFRIHTYKTRSRNSFRIRTYKKHGGWGHPRASAYFGSTQRLLNPFRSIRCAHLLSQRRRIPLNIYPVLLLPSVALAHAGLCFHIVTNYFLGNSFLLIFIQIAPRGGGHILQAKRITRLFLALLLYEPLPFGKNLTGSWKQIYWTEAIRKRRGGGSIACL
jgi:hypothetical protein